MTAIAGQTPAPARVTVRVPPVGLVTVSNALFAPSVDGVSVTSTVVEELAPSEFVAGAPTLN